MIADQGTKLDDAGLDSLPSNADSDPLRCTLVPMICDHDARLEVYVGTDERVADKGEVRKPRGVKHDRRFDLAGRPDLHSAIKKHASPKVRRRSHEARRRYNCWRLDDRDPLYPRLIVDQEAGR